MAEVDDYQFQARDHIEINQKEVRKESDTIEYKSKVRRYLYGKPVAHGGAGKFSSSTPTYLTGTANIEDVDILIKHGKPIPYAGIGKFSSSTPTYFTRTADIEDVDKLIKDGSKSGSHKENCKMLEHCVVVNWIYLKENSNATTWKNKFLECKLLSKQDIESFGKKIKRSELAECLLMKVLQNVTNDEDIKLVCSVVFKGFEDLDDKKNTEHASQRESTEKLEEVRKTLLKNQCKIEELLSREDAIAIKDHLVQDRIISLTENETLLKQEIQNHDRRSSLITEVMDIIISNLQLGSYQCLTQSLETVNTKQMEHISKLLQNVSVADSIQLGLESTGIENVQSKFYDKDIDGKTNFHMTMQATNIAGREIKQAYQPIIKSPETVNTIFTSNFAASAGKTSEGSLVINFQMMERNMQNHLKQCIRNGNVTTLVHMLFRDISVDYKDPSVLLLKVKIEVDEDSDFLEPCLENSSEMKFVFDNRSFLIEEMDTDAMEEGLTKHGINIPIPSEFVFKRRKRKERATQIIDFILVNHHQDKLVLVIKENCKEGFEYLLHRVETYETVYTTDPACLRKNILLQFSQIVKDIGIDDIQDVLLERRIVDGRTLKIKDYNRFEHGREICMATLLLNILKSCNGVRAFVDALFIMHWPSADKMLRWQNQLNVVERDSEVEICENSSGDNILFEGSFKVFINTSDAQQKCERNLLNNQRQKLRKEMIQLKSTLLNWRSNAMSVITTLKVLANELDEHFSRINVSKISGSATGIVGAVLGIVGLSLSPVTFGASLGLTIAGGVVAGVGGATVGGSLIADNVLSRKTKTRANAQLANYVDANQRIKEQCLKLSSQLEESFGTVEDKFPDWVEFWKLFVHGRRSNTAELNWSETEELLKSSLQNIGMATKFIISEGVGTGVRIAGAAIRFTGTSLHVVSGIIGALMIPFDIFTIVDSAIDVHKKNKHETSKFINKISDAIAEEIPTEENIETVIMHTLNNMHV